MKPGIIRYTKADNVELAEGDLKYHSFPWHYHNAYTVVLVEEGTIQYVFAEHNVTVGKQQILVINPYQAHCNHASENGCSYKVFFLPPSLFNSGGGTMKRFINEVIELQPAFAQLLALHQELKNADPAIPNHGLLVSVAAIIQKNVDCVAGTEIIDKRITRIIEYVTSHCDEKLTAPKLAKMASLSVFHFQRLFKSCTGLTFNAFIHQVRMEHSRKLLQEGTPLVSAALTLGYFDQSHFHHQFKKMYGLTPKQYGETAQLYKTG